MEGWVLGQCANCDAPLDRRGLFCSQFCRQVGKDVRYFRRCIADGRIEQPDVREALQIRVAHMVSGGYDERGRQLPPDVRHDVLTANGGLCVICCQLPATEVDHIGGGSMDRSNLQGLCSDCHRAKTMARFLPMSDEGLAIRDAFFERVWAEEPMRACDDEHGWDDAWRVLMKQTRAWWTSEESDALEAGYDDGGYFGDGSTGTIEDVEHGQYLEMLAARDD